MNFNLTEEQLMVQEAARDYTQRELIKDILIRDEKSQFPTHHMESLRNLGFFGMMTEPEYNGGGMDSISYCLALEEFAKVDSSVATIISVNNSLVCWGLEKYGTEEQKQKYLTKLASGKDVGAFLLSEPEAGTDATHQKTTAEDKGEYYLLNGTKNWISNANSAGIYIVIAQTNPDLGHRGINAFIVEKGWDGVSLGPHENKMGMRSSDTHSVMFTDVKVPKENRIGDDGFGFKYAMKTLEGGRLGIAALSVGIAQGALDLSIQYAKERKTFGKPIGQHQAIAFKLSDMAVKVENARNLVLKCAWLKDTGQEYGIQSAMAKQYAADIAMEVTTEAVQIHGGYGYVKEYHVERLMRDAKLCQIYEGTSEVQKIVISRDLLK